MPHQYIYLLFLKKKKVHSYKDRLSLPFHAFSSHYIFSAIISLLFLGHCAREIINIMPYIFLMSFWFLFLHESSARFLLPGLPSWVWVLQCILTAKICLNNSSWLWSNLHWTAKLIADLQLHVNLSLPGSPRGLAHQPIYLLSLHISPATSASVSVPHSLYTTQCRPAFDTT